MEKFAYFLSDQIYIINMILFKDNILFDINNIFYSDPKGVYFADLVGFIYKWFICY